MSDEDADKYWNGGKLCVSWLGGTDKKKCPEWVARRTANIFQRILNGDAEGAEIGTLFAMCFGGCCSCWCFYRLCKCCCGAKEMSADAVLADPNPKTPDGTQQQIQLVPVPVNQAGTAGQPQLIL